MFTVTPSTNERILGESPDPSDLSRVVFKYGTKFNSGEIVLVPRSRGGFVYGKASKQGKKNPCFFNPSVPHFYIQWQVEYPDANGRGSFKTLPSNLIGQLPKGSKSPVNTVTNNQNRSLGLPASLRDLSNVAFNNLNKFQVGDMVLVPRSSGGFTYGEILAPVQVSCLLPLQKDDRHPVNGWRIALDAKKSMKKELANGFIGKLPLCGAQLEKPPLVTLPETSVTKSNRPKKKLKKKRGKRGRPDTEKSVNQRFNKISKNLPPAAEIGTIKAIDETENLKDKISEDEENSEEEEEDEESESEEIFFKPKPDVENSFSEEEEDVDEEDVDEEEEEEDEEEEEILISPPRGGLITLPNPIPISNHQPKQPKKKCLVVLDAPNIARKHGKKEFSTKGIAICADYWINRGHEVVAFLPEHYVSSKPSKGSTMTIAEYLPRVDNMALIEQLDKRGILFYTPPQDYDDSYCIKYARSNNGVIVTNDLYRDHIEDTNEKDRGKTRYWIKTHCISFTFVKDQFLPNPDFKFPDHCAS